MQKNILDNFKPEVYQMLLSRNEIADLNNKSGIKQKFLGF